jgi:hypothetical protein
MLFRETVAVYCENHKEHVNIFRGQNAESCRFLARPFQFIIQTTSRHLVLHSLNYCRRLEINHKQMKIWTVSCDNFFTEQTDPLNDF